jgi:hypothetical protein
MLQGSNQLQHRSIQWKISIRSGVFPYLQPNPIPL